MRKTDSLKLICLLAIVLVTMIMVGCAQSSSTAPTETPGSDIAGTTGLATGKKAVATPVYTLGVTLAAPGAAKSDTVTVTGSGQAAENTFLVGIQTPGGLLTKEAVTASGEGGDFTVTLKVPPVKAPTDAEIVLLPSSADGTGHRQLASIPVRLEVDGSLVVREPTIRLLPDHGPSGTQIIVVGENFPVGKTVEIRLGGANAEATREAYAKTYADYSGSIMISFPMPGTWPNGDVILQSQVDVVASTPDFVSKATATFTNESSGTLTTPGKP